MHRPNTQIACKRLLFAKCSRPKLEHTGSVALTVRSRHSGQMNEYGEIRQCLGCVDYVNHVNYLDYVDYNLY